jgi:hypothetical protein
MLEGGGWSTQRHIPTPSSGKETRCRKLAGPQGRSGQVRNVGFDKRAVQLLSIRYTEYANPAHLSLKNEWKLPYTTQFSI